ncbi:hypothetical protein [Flavihumibacter fluvii]|jgi:hypothetical protein|uniref:hypothetical protein n=1 Tax=Flavihumibacter fluvii TaxID=2838157 RepID=UPI001BDF5B41|nr:hypothetical protein [Flavihumibacter fluvii]ULQ51100.1 hypothetical protein KJS93_13510 [Flavihumibacter fluvii]
MMSANINLAVLQYVIAAFVAGSLIGFAFRLKQMAKSKRRILELETEMVESHAEILRMHKFYADKFGSVEKVPVINLQKQSELDKKSITKGSG